MAAVPFFLYDAFSESTFGGSQAAILCDAASLDAGVMQQVAKELGVPATGFVTAPGDRSVGARFYSPVAELPMCGHGTMGLMTNLVERGVLNWNGCDVIEVELRLPSATAAVEISQRKDGRPLVLLDVRPPAFRQDGLDTENLAGLLGLGEDDLGRRWPIETALGDFVHLVVPIVDLAAMRKIAPNFGGLVQFCRDHDIGTVAVFCTEVERPGNTLHVRDFCPAVGVPESAAAGTTNAALISYLVRHGIVQVNGDGLIVVQAEQGHEIGRPSSIRSIVSMEGATVTRLQVGGVATKVAEGRLHLP